MDEQVNEAVISAALNNELILWEIFKFLPTSTLVSSCSLVNKMWASQARSFVQTHRECTVKIGHKCDETYGGNIWESLLELDEVLRDTKVIPFNSLRIVVTMSNLKCGEDVGMSDIKNFINKFPLKFLSVCEDGQLSSFSRSPSALTILELIRRNSSVLVELEIRSVLLNTGIFKGWQPPKKFEKLQKLCITNDSSVPAKSLLKVFQGAPRLKAVYHNCLHWLHQNVIPQHMYGALKRLAFCFRDRVLVQKFLDKLNRLEEIAVSQEGDSEDWEFCKDEHIRLCQRLLVVNAPTVCNLEMRCRVLPLLSQLQLPTLPFVKHLYLWGDEIPVCLSHVNFPVTFPNLLKVSLHHMDDFEAFNHGEIGINEEIFVAPNSSQTTLELQIENSTRLADLVSLRRLFPNLKKISLESRFGDPRQIRVVATLWPTIKSLRMVLYSFDTEEIGNQIFGLSAEELDFLRQQDDKFLKRVQIPPMCPCVATMKGLSSIEIVYPHWAGWEAVAKFVKLVEVLFTGRLSGVNFTIEKERPLDSASWALPRFGNLSEDFPYTDLDDSD